MPSEQLVAVAFDDSGTILDEEVAIVDRLFGSDIAALFKVRQDGDG